MAGDLSYLDGRALVDVPTYDEIRAGARKALDHVVAVAQGPLAHRSPGSVRKMMVQRHNSQRACVGRPELTCCMRERPLVQAPDLMTPRPGRLARIYEIDLPRPRTIEMTFEPSFIETIQDVKHTVETGGRHTVEVE